MKFVVSFVLLLVSLTAVVAAEYKLDLNPPVKVGDAYHLTGSATESNSSKVLENGNLKSTNSMAVTWTIDADVNVEEVSAKQQASVVKLDIRKFEVAAGDKSQVLLSPGTVVTAKFQGGRTLFTAAGDPVNEAAQRGLSHLAGIASPDIPTEQEIFGTPEPQPEGGEWKMNSDLFVKAMGGSAMSMDTRDVVGNFKLAEIKEVDDEQLCVVSGNVRVSKVEVPTPPNFKLSKASMNVTIDQTYPARDSRGRIAEQVTMTTAMKFNGQPQEEGPIFTIDSELVIQTDTKFTRK